MPVILLVLRTEHARIVCYNDYQAGSHACIDGKEECIGSDIHADLFHRCNGTLAGIGSSDGCFRGNFFICRPFGINFFILNDIFQDFRAGCPWVSGGNFYSCLVSASRKSFVPCHQFFHIFSLILNTQINKNCESIGINKITKKNLGHILIYAMHRLSSAEGVTA